jgi:hypothetical protein
MTANVIEGRAPAWPSTIREEFEANQFNIQRPGRHPTLV